MAKKPILFERLSEHLQADPAQLPVLEQNYAFYERANLHLAIEDLSRAAEGPPTLTGIVEDEDHMEAVR